MAGKTKIFFTTLFLFNSTYALAGELAYTCEVKHLYGLSTDGSLNISKLVELIQRRLNRLKKNQQNS